jgi:hypothetical protein
MNEWLAQQALRNEIRGDSRTYVVTDNDSSRIAGYYSLASWSTVANSPERGTDNS